MGPGDLVLNEACLSGLSLLELAVPRRDHHCSPEILILSVRCISEMHESLIRAKGFLPTCHFVGKGVFWVSCGSPSCPQSYLPDPLCAFSLCSQRASLPQRPDWLLCPASIYGCSCLGAFEPVFPLFRTPPAPFLSISLNLPSYQGPISSHLLSSELTWHFYLYHAVGDRAAGEPPGEEWTRARVPVWPWAGSFPESRFPHL